MREKGGEGRGVLRGREEGEGNFVLCMLVVRPPHCHNVFMIHKQRIIIMIERDERVR